MRDTSSNDGRELVALAGSTENVQLKITSSAVKGAPSCQTTFFLSRQITDCPSLARPPFLTVGMLSASTGTNVPSAAGAARVS